jgi:cellulose synthase/poly-beta-1,6-N-acetylglucosamine synthase-like glycosyltransferase
MLIDILLILAAAYFLLISLFAFAAFTARYSSDETYRPKVSVVIAARDEEENIGSCLASCERLSYPAEKLEVIVIDDRSTDATRSIIQGFVERHPHFKLVVAEPGTGKLQGKTNAVTQGIDHASGEILLFTDADCTLPSRWVEETVKYYDRDEVGVVAGFTYLEGAGWFSCFQAIDWFTLFTVASAGLRVGVPLTAVGTNLSVRRRAYDDVGGYRKIPFSVTEDYALFHAIVARKPYRARFPMDPGTLVVSKPCDSWPQLYRQKKRWFAGGIDMEVKILLGFGVAYLLGALLLLTPFFAWSSVYWLALLLKLAADLVLTLPSLARFRKWKLLPCWPLFQAYFFFYVLFYPPVAFLRKDVIWKDRRLRNQ